MKKNKKVIAVILAVVTVLILLLLTISRLFFSTASIKPGGFVNKYSSPDSAYELYIYKNDGGATTDSAVLGVLHKSDDENYERNIYWDYHYDDAEVEWIDDDTVVINGKRIENVLKDKYDFRYSK